ncbi:PLP-dependent aminotransferase family protein [Thalassospira australica]|uniref:aminotransferase-like domain-containing protein n=1 Tax=Thalassospira australica TaxID=1528106 RepID=UPI003850DDB3
MVQTELNNDNQDKFIMLDGAVITEDGPPIYRQLADHIEAQIRSGILSPGDRLPPQRDVARELGINLTTVTRAFSLLQKQGLIESRPGRGTLVASASRPPREENAFRSAPSDESGLIDLSVNRPATTAYIEELTSLLPRISRDPRFKSVQDYQTSDGPVWARNAVAQWAATKMGNDSARHLILTEGAQHGLSCVLMGVTQPGDVILADAITYQGINALARSHGTELRGVAMDRDGMLPDAFEAACLQWHPRAAFLVPSMQNPTAITIPEQRRRELAAIASRFNVLIIEDDVYGPLVEEDIPTFASIEPELTIYIGCLSKYIAPGLRYGFVRAPRTLVGDIASALRINCWSISPLTALIATVMIEDGTVDAIITRQKEELRARYQIVQNVLGRFDIQTQPTSTHCWVHLPEPWRAAGFARAAQREGVGVLPADTFAIGRDPVPHAVRVNIGAARSRDDLLKGLTIIANLLENGHLHLHNAV